MRWTDSFLAEQLNSLYHDLKPIRSQRRNFSSLPHARQVLHAGEIEVVDNGSRGDNGTMVIVAADCRVKELKEGDVL